MYRNLDKIIRLMQKTGDKCIFYDKETDKAYVIMPFFEYDKLMSEENSVSDLTQDELLDKINKDIATWKARQEDENIDLFEQEMDDLQVENSENNEEKFYLEPLEP